MQLEELRGGVIFPGMLRQRVELADAVIDEPNGVGGVGEVDGEMGRIRNGDVFDDAGQAAIAIARPGLAELLDEGESIGDICAGDGYAIRPMPGPECDGVGLAVGAGGDGCGEAAGPVDSLEAVDPDEFRVKQPGGLFVINGVHEKRVEGGDVRTLADADAGRQDDGAAGLPVCGQRRGGDEKCQDDADSAHVEMIGEMLGGRKKANGVRGEAPSLTASGRPVQCEPSRKSHRPPR